MLKQATGKGTALGSSFVIHGSGKNSDPADLRVAAACASLKIEEARIGSLLLEAPDADSVTTQRGPPVTVVDPATTAESPARRARSASGRLS
jgi:hypothetical protein